MEHSKHYDDPDRNKPIERAANQSTGMRCTVCCARAGEPHVPGCCEAPVPPVSVEDAMMTLDAERARRWLTRGPDRRQQQTELVPNMRQGQDRRKP